MGDNSVIRHAYLGIRIMESLWLESSPRPVSWFGCWGGIRSHNQSNRRLPVTLGSMWMGLSLSSSSKISPRFSHFPFYSPFSSFFFAISLSLLMRGGTSSGYRRRNRVQDDGMRSGIGFLCDVWGQGSGAQALWDVHPAAREGEATELNPCSFLFFILLFCACDLFLMSWCWSMFLLLRLYGEKSKLSFSDDFGVMDAWSTGKKGIFGSKIF